ncbi:MAG: hypothetical protein UT32_C0002G0021 [Parcubacteria group bacterium GW2011_GWC2_39_14]|nr:MAG: hypothetical protein UT32_C0002G0021 [Parcubacteria group bacterium GW2011_GWC2_39_14]KKR55246.1 MAG: hypothetical protein UT91_C0003G0021 [Parcubacteria group bacterium GW2011_GWA2_40_23]
MRDGCRVGMCLGLFRFGLFEAVVGYRDGEKNPENRNPCCQKDTNDRVEPCHAKEIDQLFPERGFGNSTEQVPEEFISFFVERFSFRSFQENV